MSYLKSFEQIRKKLIDGFDLKQLAKDSQLAKSQAAIRAYKELGDIDTKLSSKDYYNANEAKAIENKIDNLVRLGAHSKNYKFADAKFWFMQM